MHVLLADDHVRVRDAIGALLGETEGVTVDLVTNLTEALDAVRNTTFEVVILDLNMLGMKGLEGVRLMLEATPAPVVIMSGTAINEEIRAAFEIGIKGYIPKTLSGRALINAVRLVADGETYAPPDLFRSQGDAEPSDLTPRERDVLMQLRHGSSNKEIARLLNITETTVKLHLRSISEKLGARNRTEIIIKAIERRMI